jgi:hypothetical protein
MSMNLKIELSKEKIEKLKRCTGAQNGFNLMVEKRNLNRLQYEKKWGTKPLSTDLNY